MVSVFHLPRLSCSPFGTRPTNRIVGRCSAGGRRVVESASGQPLGWPFSARDIENLMWLLPALNSRARRLRGDVPQLPMTATREGGARPFEALIFMDRHVAAV